MYSHNNNYDLNLNNSFVLKILTKIIFVVVLVICFIFIIFSSKENKVFSQSHSEFGSNDNTKDLSGDGLILFETNDYKVYKKIRRYERYFTQGLFMDTQKTLIESSGLYGESTLQKYFIDSPDQKIYKIPIERQYFAEGACLFQDKIYQLTWKERIM
jgi:hypothetical protein